MTSRVFAGVAVSVAVLAAAVPVLTQSPPAMAKYGRFGIDLTSQNASVKPGDDFWAYANGAWDARTQIPADRASAGVGVIVTEEAEANVRGILDEMARNPAQVSVIWQGELLQIHVASKGSAAMDERPEALLVPRVGIDGERYATGLGTYSTRPHIDRPSNLHRKSRWI